VGLTVGTRLGPYEIEGMLGVGGMGEVYRARDIRLNRHVALKVLPDSVSSDPERVARLQREARTLAALNHPHIAAIYDFEEVAGTSGLVLELVDGPTLADRLRSGALQLPEGLTIAEQIADAVAAAHDKGIVHRDLKPANIKLTPGGAVKVLDFGLAKAFDQAPMPPDGTGVTVSVPAAMTRAGTVLGTPAYMSPEQARGETPDKRTDIWSFGAVVYEMLTGRRPFAGHTTTDTLAAVLKEEPDWNRVPARARRLVRHCLEKDPQRRLRDIGDAMALLEDASGPEPLFKRARWIDWLWPLATAVLLITIIAVLVARRGEPAPALHQVRFQISLLDATTMDAPILSPDGRSLAFIGQTSDAPGRLRLWLHSLESGESRQLFQANKMAGTPFWSPDSRFIAFFADGKLNRIDIAGGAVHTICEPRGVPGAGSWNRNDVIVFNSNVVMRVPASGGTPVPLTALDASHKEIGHYLPKFLPDGRRFLYLRVSPTTDESGIYIGSIDAKPEEQESTRLVATRAGAIYAPSQQGQTGYLLFLRGSTLMAQRFNPARLELGSEAVRVAEQVEFAGVPSSRYAYASVSDTGVLAYRPSETVNGVLVWVDRNGREAGPAVQDTLPNPQNPRLSPDGKRVALMLSGDLWVYDLTGRPPVKLTFDASSDIPLWAPDGRRLVYASNASPTRLLSVSSEISGDPPQAVSPPGHYHPHGWSQDGREMIAVLNSYSPTNWDIVKLPVQQPGDPQPILTTPSAEGMTGAAVSPNSQWLAYTSTVTGNFEVWVQPYPGPGAPVRVSPNGGADPVWAKNGRELYYLEGKKMMAVSVGAGPTFDFKRPVVLFNSVYLHPPGSPLSYDVGADGRFIMLKRVDTQTAPTPIQVVLNWTAALGR
jgi:eukaryotic-like serine/threonine-protein kinase